MHISASSKQPTGMSKCSSPVFRIHGGVPSKRRVFLACTMIDKSLSEIWMNCLVNLIDYLNKLLEIDGYKFSTSKHRNDEVCLCVIFSNHVITEDVFFHWFVLVLESTTELIFFNNTLLIFPRLVFEGFNKLHHTR